jgi:colanic acid/amylovoran biosynthesis protein
MPKILIYNPMEFRNMGTVAALMGLIKCLVKYMPDVKITALGLQPAKDRNFEKLGIELRQYPWLRPGKTKLLVMANAAILAFYHCSRCFLYHLARAFNRKIDNPYRQYDVVIHNNADTLSDRAHGSVSTLIGLLLALLGRVLYGKPMATVATDIGPFTSRLTRFLARFVLNRFDVLALREEKSYDYCRRLGLNKPKMYLVADPAFLLEPVSREKARHILQNEGIDRGVKPLIGFSPSWFQMKRYALFETAEAEEKRTKYIELMANMIDYIVDKLDAAICFIPHVTGSAQWGEYRQNDRRVCCQIYESMRNKRAARILRGDYLPDELKGVIGSCDTFIGCRMHSVIAAVSLGVPAITIACGDKFYGIIGKSMGQEAYIVDIRNPDFASVLAELKSKLDSLWANRHRVSQELKERAKTAEEQALFYGEFIKDLVASSKKASASQACQPQEFACRSGEAGQKSD